MEQYIPFAVLNNALLAFIALCTLIGAILSYRSDKKSERTLDVVTQQGEVINKLEVNTNSMKDALVAATAKASQAEGKAEGIASERANPQSPARVEITQQPLDVKIIPDETIPVKQVK